MDLQRAGRARGLAEPYVVDDGRFHPSDDPGWWDLDRNDSDETREAWRERLSR